MSAANALAALLHVLLVLGIFGFIVFVYDLLFSHVIIALLGTLG